MLPFFSTNNCSWSPPSPWRATFAPKTVHSVTFRIDRVQGQQTGLAEIMVYGAVNP
jgi:hypothetical protein